MRAKTLIVIALLALLAALFSIPITAARAQGIGTLDQWTSTSSPTSAITQRTFGKALKLTGLSAGCLELSAGLVVTSSGVACGTGSSSFGKTWEINASGVLAPTTTLPVLVPGAFYASSTALIGSTVTASSYVATSTTATSTLAGGLAIETSGFVYDYSTNRVGIATSSPGTTFSVNGTTVLDGDVAFDPNGAGGAGNNRTLNFGQAYGRTALMLYDGPTNGKWGWGLNAGEMQFFATTNSTNHFSWNGGGGLQTPGTNELMRLTTAGNLGIGSTTPSSPLVVTSSTEPKVVIEGTGNTFLQLSRTGAASWYEGFSSSNLIFDTAPIANGGAKLTLGSSGGVSIGTTTVSATAGNVITSGTPSSGAGAITVYTTGYISPLPTLRGSEGLVLYRNGGGSSESSVAIIGGVSGGARVSFGDSGSVNQGFVNYDNSTDSLALGANATEAVRITSGGNIGIGTSTPLGALHVDGNLFITNGGGNSYLRFAENSAANYIQSGTAFSTGSTKDLRFTSINNSATWLAIDADAGGNVGVATTSPWRTFSVVGTMSVNGLSLNTGAAAASLCLSSTNEVTRNTDNETCLSSSARFKKNIETLRGSSIDEVLRLRPVSFEYREQPGAHYGLIAEEAGAVDPLLISEDDEGLPNGIRWSHVTALLVKAMQEIAARDDDQDERVEALEARIEILERKNRQLISQCAFPFL